MDKEDLEGYSDNPEFIPGIYNYCDRWCERCAFTARCLNYDLTEKQFDNNESRDINNKKFWDKISDQFILTMEMLEEEAKDLGINLNHASDININIHQGKIENHPLIRETRKYIDFVDNWFQLLNNSENDKQILLIKEPIVNISKDELPDKSLKIAEATDVIKWYHIQISVKLERAFFSRINEEQEYDDEDQKDSDGSAKVALIGIDRSIAAWGKLYNYFDEGEDDILDILLHLIKIKDIAELEFPDARSFVRPGFDDQESEEEI
jgi:hypothetical protein